VREAERAQVLDDWKDRVGELINGVVKRVERGSVYVDLGGNAGAGHCPDEQREGENSKSETARAHVYGNWGQIRITSAGE